MKLTRRDRERNNREKEILKAATHVFAKHGYDNASMNEIAEEAEFTKRTLYKYFSDKSELFLTVAINIYKEMLNSVIEIALENDTGYECMKLVLLTYFDLYSAIDNRIKIINDIGKVRGVSSSNLINEFIEIDKRIFNKIQAIIIKGQKDGSINNTLVVEQTSYTIMFLMTGFLNQLVDTGASFTRHINMDINKFIDDSVRYLLTPLI